MYKTRHLSLIEYLVQLEKEYVSAFIRSKIYPKNIVSYNKHYWIKVCEKKLKNIENICSRNNLIPINQDKEKLLQVQNTLLIRGQLPIFCYRDNHEKSVLQPTDLEYYYAIGKSFSISEKQIGELQSVDLKNQAAIIKIGLKEIPVNIVSLIRIL